jgi:small subunit ribosomal protein S1
MEGLVHVSKMQSLNLSHPTDMFKSGDEVLVRILDIDPNRQRVQMDIDSITTDEQVAWLEATQPQDTQDEPAQDMPEDESQDVLDETVEDMPEDESQAVVDDISEDMPEATPLDALDEISEAL